ncbi:MAG: RNase adaptor protein RapZ, partial [Actinobacteria bacterium]|nr:RNase adaptor protein RapZ [Actinomycetota bacterium]
MSAEESAEAKAEVEPVPLEDVVVITGVSGAGKSTAMEAFE